MYSNCKLYGPYTRKDGRQHIICVNLISKSRKTISYPKYIMEIHLGRYLNEDETVDHIDRNYSNNELTNLRVIARTQHSSEDSIRNENVTVHCAFCGKEFEIIGSKISQRNRLDKGNTGYFCSKRCSGLYGKQVQETGIRLSKKERINPNKYINKNGLMVKMVNTLDLSSSGQ